MRMTEQKYKNLCTKEDKEKQIEIEKREKERHKNGEIV